MARVVAALPPLMVRPVPDMVRVVMVRSPGPVIVPPVWVTVSMVVAALTVRVPADTIRVVTSYVAPALRMTLLAPATRSSPAPSTVLVAAYVYVPALWLTTAPLAMAVMPAPPAVAAEIWMVPVCTSSRPSLVSVAVRFVVPATVLARMPLGVMVTGTLIRLRPPRVSSWSRCRRPCPPPALDRAPLPVSEASTSKSRVRPRTMVPEGTDRKALPVARVVAALPPLMVRPVPDMVRVVMVRSPGPVIVPPVWVTVSMVVAALTVRVPADTARVVTSYVAPALRMTLLAPATRSSPAPSTVLVAAYVYVPALWLTTAPLAMAVMPAPPAVAAEIWMVPVCTSSRPSLVSVAVRFVVPATVLARMPLGVMVTGTLIWLRPPRVSSWSRCRRPCPPPALDRAPLPVSEASTSKSRVRPRTMVPEGTDRKALPVARVVAALPPLMVRPVPDMVRVVMVRSPGPVIVPPVWVTVSMVVAALTVRVPADTVRVVTSYVAPALRMTLLAPATRSSPAPSTVLVAAYVYVPALWLTTAPLAMAVMPEDDPDAADSCRMPPVTSSRPAFVTMPDTIFVPAATLSMIPLAVVVRGRLTVPAPREHDLAGDRHDARAGRVAVDGQEGPGVDRRPGRPGHGQGGAGLDDQVAARADLEGPGEAGLARPDDHGSADAHVVRGRGHAVGAPVRRGRPLAVAATAIERLGRRVAGGRGGRPHLAGQQEREGEDRRRPEEHQPLRVRGVHDDPLSLCRSVAQSIASNASAIRSTGRAISSAAAMSAAVDGASNTWSTDSSPGRNVVRT